VLARLLPHISSSLNVDSHQSAYAHGKSTETSLLRVLHDLHGLNDDGYLALMIRLIISAGEPSSFNPCKSFSTCNKDVSVLLPCAYADLHMRNCIVLLLLLNNLNVGHLSCVRLHQPWNTAQHASARLRTCRPRTGFDLVISYRSVTNGVCLRGIVWYYTLYFQGSSRECRGSFHVKSTRFSIKRNINDSDFVKIW